MHDLDVTPWPFADNRFDQVYAFDVIEHLADVVAAMEELHRICRNGASIEISVPHFSSGNAFTDPTHRHFFSRFSFDYFDSSHEFAFYSEARFRVVRSNLIFARSPLNRLVSRLANRYPRKYRGALGLDVPGVVPVCAAAGPEVRPHGGGAHSAPARERRGAWGPRKRPSRGPGRSPGLS